MAKPPPELTWQDKAILVVIPLVVFVIFIVANYVSRDLTIDEAFKKKFEKSMIRDSGFIVELFPPSDIASNTQKCKLRSRDSGIDFVFQYNVQGSQTMNLQIGRLVQFYGEYRYDSKGGILEVPFKGKSGRMMGWAVYENHRYYSYDQEDKGDL